MSEHDPYATPEEVAEKAATEALRKQEARQVVTDDACWLASGPRGRRILRRALRDSGIDVMELRIGASLNVSNAQLCFNEGARAFGLKLLVQLMRGLATGDLKLESWQLLMTEKDSNG